MTTNQDHASEPTARSILQTDSRIVKILRKGLRIFPRRSREDVKRKAQNSNGTASLHLKEEPGLRLYNFPSRPSSPTLFVSAASSPPTRGLPLIPSTASEVRSRLGGISTKGALTPLLSGRNIDNGSGHCLQTRGYSKFVATNDYSSIDGVSDGGKLAHDEDVSQSSSLQTLYEFVSSKETSQPQRPPSSEDQCLPCRESWVLPRSASTLQGTSPQSTCEQTTTSPMALRKPADSRKGPRPVSPQTPPPSPNCNKDSSRNWPLPNPTLYRTFQEEGFIVYR
ncbi:hypothetical protein KCU77_g3926, partial [Aureobasidium melanogenum]